MRILKETRDKEEIEKYKKKSISFQQIEDWRSYRVDKNIEMLVYDEGNAAIIMEIEFNENNYKKAA